MQRRFSVFAALAFAGVLLSPVSSFAGTEPHDGHGSGHAASDSHGAPAAHGDGHGAAGAHGGGHGDLHINWFSFDYGPGKTYPNPPLGFAIFNFAILIGLLVKFGGPKIRQSLASRHDSIRNALEEGARLRKEAQAKLEEYKQRISKVDAEVEQLVSEIRAQAEEEKKRILEEAEKQAAAMKKNAEDRIDAEIARARRLLEAEVVSAAVDATEKMLVEHTRGDDQARLVDTFISSIGASGAGGDDKSKGAVDDSW